MKDKLINKLKYSNIDYTIFLPSILVSCIFLMLIIIYPIQSKVITNGILSFLTKNLGWLYSIVCICAFGFSVYISFSKIGNIKLGEKDEEPEFSYFSWVSMIFAAGVGIGLMLFGFLEPIMYLNDPPFDIIAHSNEAFEWAHMYGQFHWGISAWAFYVPIAISVAYYIHVRKKETTKISSVCKPILGRYSKSEISSIIDIFVIFGMLGGIGASLGLAVPMISTIASEVLDIPDSWMLKLIIILIWILLFGISVYRGLDKGIKIFSNINIVLAIGFAIFVFFIGPSRFILKIETNSIGLYLQNVIRMSFWTDPIGQGGFVERWTAFYWGWWLAYAPMMGLFIARISKGRTLKQVSVGMITWGALGSCFFFAIFGGYSLYLEKNNILNISQILNTLGREMAIIEILKTVPFSNFIIIMYGIICFIFLATTIDSSAYVLASVCTKRLKGNEEPERWNRLLWAFVFGLVAVSLVLLGGLESAQASAIIGGTPIIIIFVILVLSLKKMIKEDYPNLLRKEKYSLEEKNK